MSLRRFSTRGLDEVYRRPRRPSRGAWSFGAVALWGILAVGGCAPDAVDVAADPFAAEVRVVEGPELRIGSLDDPAFAFTRISRLATLPDGTILTFHGQEQVIRRWTAQGEPNGTIGGEGEGPGEFRSVREFGVFGDTVWAMDSRGFRATYFAADGEVIETVTVPASIGERGMAPSELPPRPQRPFRDRTLHAVPPAFSQAVATGELTEVTHYRMARDGSLLDSLWTQETRSTDNLAILREGGGTFTRQPFGDSDISVTHDDGISILDRRTPESAEGAAVRVTRLDVGGDTLFHTALPFRPVPLNAAQVDSAANEVADGLASFMVDRLGLSVSDLQSDVYDAMYAPAFWPWAAALFLTRDGSTWVRLADSSRPGQVEWRILDDVGEPDATLFTPEGLRVLHVEGDELLGVETDEFDVEYIVRYRIRAEASQGSE